MYWHVLSPAICCMYMMSDTHTLSHHSTADEVWYWLKCALCAHLTSRPEGCSWPRELFSLYISALFCCHFNTGIQWCSCGSDFFETSYVRRKSNLHVEALFPESATQKWLFHMEGCFANTCIHLLQQHTRIDVVINECPYQAVLRPTYTILLWLGLHSWSFLTTVQVTFWLISDQQLCLSCVLWVESGAWDCLLYCSSSVPCFPSPLQLLPQSLAVASPVPCSCFPSPLLPQSLAFSVSCWCLYSLCSTLSHLLVDYVWGDSLEWCSQYWNLVTSMQSSIEQWLAYVYMYR